MKAKVRKVAVGCAAAARLVGADRPVVVEGVRASVRLTSVLTLWYCLLIPMPTSGCVFVRLAQPLCWKSASIDVFELGGRRRRRWG